MPSVPLTDPRIHWSSRWLLQPDLQKAVAHWAGATLRFYARGTQVYIGTGDSERLDEYNGGIPMTMTRITDPQTGSHIEKYCEFLQPTAIIPAVETEDLEQLGKDTVLCVELVLSDWASRLEIVSIVVDDVDGLLPLDVCLPTETQPGVNALFIGDSITCGFVDHSDALLAEGAAENGEIGEETHTASLMPRGCWDAYPYVTESLMRSVYGVEHFETEISAYPGATLVDPPKDDDDDDDDDDEEDEEEIPFITCALSKKFFHASPLPHHEERTRLERCAPHIIIIALGTNDEDVQMKPEHFDATLREFVVNLAGEFRDTLAHVVVLRPFPFFRTDEPDDWLMLASRDLSGVVADLEKTLQEDLAVTVRFHVWEITDKNYDESHTIDGTHPRVQGHKVLGENLAERLDGVLGKNCAPDCRLCSQLRSKDEA
ncbi:hypothetical protein EXIGLDRAFT_746944 [Exidia glandulosa HHB12029]|uniref:Uncharacterized protein n=1 Tax=Exidia glandulosa HHB12029 TaxID=1314781 RepID=A0A165LFN5_EXIGL|nr:hypothetical protein EXIGLDRAFT_746944 [Exidia glandulosa HHB12029]